MENLKRGKKFIFVGGVERSGTTLVQNILDSHPDICGIPEYKIIYPIIKLRNQFRYWVECGLIDSQTCLQDELDQRICRFIESFLNPIIDEYGCKFLSEKSPTNVSAFLELLNLFPESKFIHVVRDPRAVISSLIQVRKKIEQKRAEPMMSYTEAFVGVRSTSEYVRQILERGFQATKKSPNKILTILYEELVKNPKIETKRICQFLNLNWSDRMLSPGDFKHMGERGMTVEVASAWYDKQSYYRNPEVKEIEKWKWMLATDQQVRIAEEFKDFKDLVNLGYDFSLDYLSPKNRLKGKIISRIRLLIGNFRLCMRKILKRFI